MARGAAERRFALNSELQAPSPADAALAILLDSTAARRAALEVAALLVQIEARADALCALALAVREGRAR